MTNSHRIFPLGSLVFIFESQVGRSSLNCIFFGSTSEVDTYLLEYNQLRASTDLGIG